MNITINIPPTIETAMRAAWGDGLPRAALEALAVESYRTGKLSLGMLAEMLGMGVIEADQWLAARGVMIPMSVDELRQELDVLTSPSGRA